MLQKRLCELSNIAYNRSIVTFSDFLGLNELNILHTTPKTMLTAGYKTFGGYDFAERQMVAFLPDALYYEYEYPFVILEVVPLNLRFAEELTHRDYLGAFMNLGIERSKMGDILVEDKTAVLFMKEDLSDYVMKHLTRIRHTSVQAVKKERASISYEPAFERLTGTVASVRLDTVMSVAWPLSRSKLTAYIEGGKVYVNGKLVTSNGARLQEKDVISVRGMGRISFQEILSETKKGRYLIVVHKYI